MKLINNVLLSVKVHLTFKYTDLQFEYNGNVSTLLCHISMSKVAQTSLQEQQKYCLIYTSTVCDRICLLRLNRYPTINLINVRHILSFEVAI